MRMPRSPSQARFRCGTASLRAVPRRCRRPRPRCAWRGGAHTKSRRCASASESLPAGSASFLACRLQFQGTARRLAASSRGRLLAVLWSPRSRRRSALGEEIGSVSFVSVRPASQPVLRLSRNACARACFWLRSRARLTSTSSTEPSVTLPPFSIMRPSGQRRTGTRCAVAAPCRVGSRARRPAWPSRALADGRATRRSCRAQRLRPSAPCRRARCTAFPPGVASISPSCSPLGGVSRVAVRPAKRRMAFDSHPPRPSATLATAAPAHRAKRIVVRAGDAIPVGALRVAPAAEVDDADCPRRRRVRSEPPRRALARRTCRSRRYAQARRTAPSARRAPGRCARCSRSARRGCSTPACRWTSVVRSSAPPCRGSCAPSFGAPRRGAGSDTCPGRGITCRDAARGRAASRSTGTAPARAACTPGS